MKDYITKTLSDVDNTMPIALFDERGKQTVFEQLAVIPFAANGENRLYAVLSPTVDTAYLKRGEAIVVRAYDNGVAVEHDGKIAAAVYDRYVALINKRNRASAHIG